jgi:hypothetical protein
VLKQCKIADSRLTSGCMSETNVRVPRRSQRPRDGACHQIYRSADAGDLPHGKLVNMRPETVEHEFVNAPFRRPERSQFEIATTDWIEFDRPGMRDWLTALLCDLGTGLGIGLYEEALTQYLGGREQVDRDVEVISAGRRLGYQRFRLIQPDVAFKITAFKNRPPEFEAHARRLLAHTPLRAIQWINVGRREVSFQTLRAKD